MPLRELISAAVAALIGAVAWRGSIWAIGLALAMPVLVFVQPRRSTASAVAIAYYAAATWPLMATARAFWSLPGSSPLPPIACISASLLLATPLIILWSANRLQAIWRCPLALFVSGLPPLGVIGWASPLVAAGVLFPGTHWFGMAVTLLLPGAVIRRETCRPAVAIAALLAFAASLIWTAPTAPNDWAAINTVIDTARRSDPITDFEAIQDLQASATQTDGRVLLAPESAVMRWNDGTTELWQRTIHDLMRRDVTMLLGTSFAIPGSTRYRNALLAIGADSATFVQRNPVPIAMWKPFGTPNGTDLRFAGRGTLDVAGRRAAVLICYEQLLVWPMLHSALERPALILGIANDYWCRGTHIPAAQQTCMKAWARLFGLPVVSATNYGGER